MPKVKGRTIWIQGPNMLGFLRNFVSQGTMWELRFECGACGAKSTVQHDDERNWHKCPACGERNILDRYSYFG